MNNEFTLYGVLGLFITIYLASSVVVMLAQKWVWLKSASSNNLASFIASTAIVMGLTVWSTHLITMTFIAPNALNSLQFIHLILSASIMVLTTFLMVNTASVRATSAAHPHASIPASIVAVGVGLMFYISLNAISMPKDIDINFFFIFVLFCGVWFASWVIVKVWQLKIFSLDLINVTDDIAWQEGACSDALKEQSLINDSLLETLAAVVLVLDREGRVLKFNAAAEKITGYAEDEVLGKPVWESMLEPTEVDKFINEFNDVVVNIGAIHEQYRLVKKDGGEAMFNWHCVAVSNHNHVVEHVVMTAIDVNRPLADEDRMSLSEVAFETLEGLVVTDPNCQIVRVNRAFENITGYLESEVYGESIKMLRSERHDDAFYEDIWQSVATNGYWQGEIWNKRKNAEVYPSLFKVTRVLNSQGEVINYIGNCTDLTERKRIELELQQLAFYDEVTGLPNRRLLSERIKESVASANEKGHTVGLIFIDLDNFKHINDNFGHGFGDELLQAFAENLNNLIAPEITVSRFGGDEFVILLNELPRHHASATMQCERIAEIIQFTFAKGVEVRNKLMHISTSIGITVSDCCEDDEHSLLMQADAAMYRAKAMGKNTMRFYNTDIGASMNEFFVLEAALRQELMKPAGENNLFMVYQPQYDLDKNIIGAEALVRWVSEEHGFVSPARFVEVAEESGLIDELGIQVVEQVLDDIKRMESVANQSSLQHISINLSIKQLTNPNLTDRLMKTFEQKQVAPQKVRFEFTESAFLDIALNPEKLFAEMSDMGFTFALDDFGTGFSSLSYLKDLPISELKIDKSFIDGIPGDDDDMTICSATIDMAQKLGLEVVAEGVEEVAQFEWLKDYGCDILQGYLLSKPVAYDDFVALLADSKAK